MRDAQPDHTYTYPPPRPSRSTASHGSPPHLRAFTRWLPVALSPRVQTTVALHLQHIEKCHQPSHL
eukprot:11193-Eustigmatos_ZCMA.PRE.1